MISYIDNISPKQFLYRPMALQSGAQLEIHRFGYRLESFPNTQEKNNRARNPFPKEPRPKFIGSASFA
jgi:hypothetical protein